MNIRQRVISGESYNIPNTRRDIDLYGYIWIDTGRGKGSELNSLYDNGEDIIDPKDINIYLYKNDEPVEAIIEGKRKILKKHNDDDIKRGESSTKETAKKPITTIDGKLQYCFENLDYQNIEDYEVKFEYNGMKYETVQPKATLDNGSKVKEEDRDKFNNNFCTIDKNGSVNNGEVIEYTQENHQSTVKYGGNNDYLGDAKYHIIATTDGTYNFISGGGTTSSSGDDNSYTLCVNAIDSIKNVNLGLRVRAQPDLAVIKDLERVKINVNGKSNTYNYGQKFSVDSNDYLDEVEIEGIRKYEGSYTKPMFRSDITNIDQGNYIDKSNELEMKVDYIIKIENQSSSLTSYVNAITEKWSSNFEKQLLVTMLNDNDEIDIPKEKTVGSESEGYWEKTIDFKESGVDPIEIGPLKTARIRVELTLTREAMVSMFGNNIVDGLTTPELNNFVEISEYATESGGKTYAGVDSDSQPDNADFEISDGKIDRTTFEDDTDAAPGFTLTLKGSRVIAGTVFEDNAVFEDGNYTDLHTGEHRLGNQKYDNGENKINGVTVQLIYKDSFDKENGNIKPRRNSNL